MDTNWYKTIPATDIAPGAWRGVLVAGNAIVIFNVDGEFFALADYCTHDGNILSDGDVENGEIICARHGARFCIRTGEVKAPPAYEDVPCYPTRVVAGIIEVSLLVI